MHSPSGCPVKYIIADDVFFAIVSKEMADNRYLALSRPDGSDIFSVYGEVGCFPRGIVQIFCSKNIMWLALAGMKSIGYSCLQVEDRVLIRG